MRGFEVVIVMKETTKERLKQFEQDHEIYVSATDALTYWVLYARITRESDPETRNYHHGLKFVTGPRQDGNVLVLRDPFISDQYSAEEWGKMETIDDFVEKGLARILEEKETMAGTTPEGCGTSCA
ncbi:MAG TPA: hypothetical protein VHN82_06635 [Methanoregula sp.]|nr:hypothetical protein [Methanoregula sp.]